MTETKPNEKHLDSDLFRDQSLEERFADKRVFSERDTVLIARRVCEQMHKIREMDTPFKDLVPEKIILTNDERVRIVSESDGKSETESKSISLYQGDYKSPERVSGERPDECSDVYAMGCIMLEMMTGLKPLYNSLPDDFSTYNPNDAASLKKLVTGSGLHPGMQNVILKCLEAEPRKRFQNLNALEMALLSYTKPKKKDGLTAAAVALILIAGIVASAIALRYQWSELPKISDRAFTTPSTPIAVAAEDFDIKDRRDGRLIYHPTDVDSIEESVTQAVRDGVSLKYADLRGAELVQVHLSSADLENADLSGANLTQAVLKNINLKETILTDCRLSQAKISNTEMNKAMLRRAELGQAVLKSVDLEDANFEDASLSQCQAPNISFARANLKGCKLTQAVLTGADFRNADLAGSDLTQTKLADSKCETSIFDGAKLVQTHFENANLTGASFKECDPIQVRASGANLRGITPRLVIRDSYLEK